MRFTPKHGSLISPLQLAACTAIMSLPMLAQAAPAEVALLQNAARVPKLQERLPVQAVENSVVVGQLTPGLMAAASITISLEDGSSLLALRQREAIGLMGSRSWVGEFANSPGSQLVLTEHKGVITGFLLRDEAIYEILPSRSHAAAHVLYRIDESRMPGTSEPAIVEGGDASESAGEILAGGSGPIIDLMVVYTPATRTRYGQAVLESRIISAVESSNQAMANSGVDASFNLVYMSEVRYTETGDMTQALTALQGTSDGKMDEVHALRDEYGADLVQLVNEDSNWCGYANIMRNVSTSFAPYAFSVVGSDCLSNLTVQHEIGHNLGSHHDRESTTSTGAYAYSYGYRRCSTDGTGVRTLMSYPCSNLTRINYFSDPYETWNGYPLGIAYETSPGESADNARSLRSTVATAAAFRSPSGTAGSIPAAPGNAIAVAASDTQVDVSWSDASDNESGFRIERSTNGVDFSEIASLGPNVSRFTSTGLAPGSWNYFRVRAWNSTGNSPYSNVASARTDDAAPPPPAAPEAVAAAAMGSEVTVAWTDMSGNEAGFEIRREKYNSRKGTWGSASTMSVGANLTSVVDSPGSGTFRYSVRSYNAGGSSPWAGPAEVSVAGSTTKGGGNGKSGTKGGNGKGGSKQ